MPQQTASHQKTFRLRFQSRFFTLLAKRSDDKVSGKWPKHMETFTNIKALNANGKMACTRATGWLVVVFHQPHPEKKEDAMFVKMSWVKFIFPQGFGVNIRKKQLSGNHLGQYMCQGSRTQLQKYWG